MAHAHRASPSPRVARPTPSPAHAQRGTGPRKLWAGPLCRKPRPLLGNPSRPRPPRQAGLGAWPAGGGGRWLGAGGRGRERGCRHAGEGSADWLAPRGGWSRKPAAPVSVREPPTGTEGPCWAPRSAVGCRGRERGGAGRCSGPAGGGGRDPGSSPGRAGAPSPELPGAPCSAGAAPGSAKWGPVP